MLYRPMKEYIPGGVSLLKKHTRPKDVSRRMWKNMVLRCCLDSREFLWATMRRNFPMIPKEALLDLLVYGIQSSAEDEDAT